MRIGFIFLNEARKAAASIAQLFQSMKVSGVRSRSAAAIIIPIIIGFIPSMAPDT